MKDYQGRESHTHFLSRVRYYTGYGEMVESTCYILGKEDDLMITNQPGLVDCPECVCMRNS